MVHQVLESRVESRVIDAALTCIGRVGVAKTTLDDVAREAGCARATVYRYYPGKQPLLHAVVVRETDRLTALVIRAADAEEDLAGAATAVLTSGAEFLLGHTALRCMLAVEPEVLLPHISFARGDVMLAVCASRLAPAFTRFLEPDRARRLSEWLVRFGMSYLCSEQATELLERDRVRALVEDFVLPGLDRPVLSEGIIPS